MPLKSVFKSAARGSWWLTRQFYESGVVIYKTGAVMMALSVGTFEFAKPLVGVPLDRFVKTHNLDPRLYAGIDSKNLLVIERDSANQTWPERILYRIYEAGKLQRSVYLGEYTGEVGNAASRDKNLMSGPDSLTEEQRQKTAKIVQYGIYGLTAVFYPFIVVSTLLNQPVVPDGMSGDYAEPRPDQTGECDVFIGEPEDKFIPRTADELGLPADKLVVSGVSARDDYNFSLLHEIGHCNNLVVERGRYGFAIAHEKEKAYTVKFETESDRFALSHMRILPNASRLTEFIRDWRAVEMTRHVDLDHNTAPNLLRIPDGEIPLQDAGEAHKNGGIFVGFIAKADDSLETLFRARQNRLWDDHKTALDKIQQDNPDISLKEIFNIIEKTATQAKDDDDRFFHTLDTRDYAISRYLLQDENAVREHIGEGGLAQMKMFVEGLERLEPAIVNDPSVQYIHDLAAQCPTGDNACRIFRRNGPGPQ